MTAEELFNHAGIDPRQYADQLGYLLSGPAACAAVLGVEQAVRLTAQLCARVAPDELAELVASLPDANLLGTVKAADIRCGVES